MSRKGAAAKRPQAPRGSEPHKIFLYQVDHPAAMPEKIFCEVVDAFNHPLCILSQSEIQRQKLLHRAVAVCLSDRDGRFLLCRCKDGAFGFSAFGAVRAGMGSEDCCRMLIPNLWRGEPLKTRLSRMLQPSEASGNAFIYIYEATVFCRFETRLTSVDEDFLILDAMELSAMQDRQDFLSPLFSIACKECGWGR